MITKLKQIIQKFEDYCKEVFKPSQKFERKHSEFVYFLRVLHWNFLKKYEFLFFEVTNSLIAQMPNKKKVGQYLKR